ncbi:sporulation integral membrane protein YtvI [Caldanaerobacter sp.]|uniref:sporulation integral membrane protein YtvI n=1 Tax=Caldanaerobacter sp. TaxID=2930036 RepID=UPI003C75DFED
MENFFAKYGSIIRQIFIVISVFLIFYIIIFKLIPFLMPFVVALIFAVIIDPGVNFLEKKLRVPRGLASFFLLLLLVALITYAIVLGIYQLIYEFNSLAEMAPAFTPSLNTYVNNLIEKVKSYYITLPPNITSFVEGEIQTIVDYLSNFAKNIAGWLIALATKLPNFFFMTLISLVSAFFMSKDKYLILDFIKRQFPPHWSEHAKNIQVDLWKTAFGYLKATLIVLFINFLEASIGLAIIGIKYYILLGLLISVADLLPALGSGFVLIPWALYHILTKNYLLGIYLLILYGVITVVRQMVEPKILGVTIGLHPLVILLSMFIGAKLFGFIGLIMGPVFVVIFKALQRAEIIPPWK